MTSVPARLEHWIDLTVCHLLAERPDIDPARADDLRAELRRAVEPHASAGSVSARMVLESGWMGSSLDPFVASYGWPEERRESARGRTEVVWRVDDENRFHVVASDLYPCEYCVFSGPDALALMAIVSARVAFLDASDLQHAARVASTDDERRAIVWALAAGARARRLRGALREARDVVRRGAAAARRSRGGGAHGVGGVRARAPVSPA